MIFALPDGSPIDPDTLSRNWLNNTLGDRPGDQSTQSAPSPCFELDLGRDRILAVSRRLGHANAAITLGVYGHLCSNVDSRASQALEAMFARSRACRQKTKPRAMTKSHLTPEQRFKQLFNLSLDKSATSKRAEAAERKWEEWLKRHDKTRLDFPEILADVVEHDKPAKALIRLRIRATTARRAQGGARIRRPKAQSRHPDRAVRAPLSGHERAHARRLSAVDRRDPRL